MSPYLKIYSDFCRVTWATIRIIDGTIIYTPKVFVYSFVYVLYTLKCRKIDEFNSLMVVLEKH